MVTGSVRTGLGRCGFVVFNSSRCRALNMVHDLKGGKLEPSIVLRPGCDSRPFVYPGDECMNRIRVMSSITSKCVLLLRGCNGRGLGPFLCAYSS